VILALLRICSEVSAARQPVLDLLHSFLGSLARALAAGAFGMSHRYFSFALLTSACYPQSAQ
jgi:hypothetical protein